jgi:hypothetical protein
MREVVERGPQALQNGSGSGGAAHPLGDLVADVGGRKVREDERVCAASDLRLRRLLRRDGLYDRHVELEIAVDDETRQTLAQELGRFAHDPDRRVVRTGMCAEAQHRHAPGLPGA